MPTSQRKIGSKGSTMISDLSTPALELISRLAKQELSKRENLEPGSYRVDEMIVVSGSVGRNDPSYVKARVTPGDLLRSALLGYATKAGGPGISWLENLLDAKRMQRDGILPAKNLQIDPRAEIILDRFIDEMKPIIVNSLPQSKREGDTSVLGTLMTARTSEEVNGRKIRESDRKTD